MVAKMYIFRDDAKEHLIHVLYIYVYVKNNTHQVLKIFLFNLFKFLRNLDNNPYITII